MINCCHTPSSSTPLHSSDFAMHIFSASLFQTFINIQVWLKYQEVQEYIEDIPVVWFDQNVDWSYYMPANSENCLFISMYFPLFFNIKFIFQNQFVIPMDAVIERNSKIIEKNIAKLLLNENQNENDIIIKTAIQNGTNNIRKKLRSTNCSYDKKNNKFIIEENGNLKIWKDLHPSEDFLLNEPATYGFRVV